MATWYVSLAFSSHHCTHSMQVIREVEHLCDNEVSPTPSDDTTLVGTPSILTDKPESVDAHTVTDSPELMDPIAASSPPPSSLHLAASCTSEVEIKIEIVDVDESPSTAVRTVTSEDFQVVGELGEGGQASVYLVQERATERLYALKAAEKSEYPEMNELMFREQAVLESIAGSPWFLSLKASFEDDQFFFLLTVSSNYASSSRICTDMFHRTCAWAVAWRVVSSAAMAGSWRMGQRAVTVRRSYVAFDGQVSSYTG